ncbi:hypothetical protein CONCODRAFT_16398 [Conidiobolus coronatus NRRL 28638]|uniref:DUF7707 domain-containing protein n=1 Tax=Conidiobolus coronatus (strain ATCC 28846 / CBS 209.66 / NRRL 28638) TaxID=796925 RepID=A0A137PAY5_CONC2|nr:hypothetical protein CONCODRAFT_16398 [Conidiobolus coronatus NRRL 28638]|eukprot:KXN72155.1 hypothetical protein CONCODRAFT_16398 [Conidiobolus coronatus NRRL 28638]
MKLTTIFIGLSSVLNLSAQSPSISKEKICTDNKLYCEVFCGLSGGTKTNTCSELDLSFECTCNDSTMPITEYYNSFPANYKTCSVSLRECSDDCNDDFLCNLNCFKRHICIYEQFYRDFTTDFFESTQAEDSDTQVDSPKLTKGSETQSRQRMFIE